ncbi:MAG: PEP/pyruvate-binding domain-containing protein [Planctomycetota bacterium]
MTAETKWVYFFGEGDSEGDPERRDILGGKGASLAAMSRAGLPVPPGFTISAELCPLIEQTGGKWPEGLEEQVRDALARLEELTGRTFGRGHRPLFVAVRSGAAVSMPGMMDTILNCGMNPSLAAHLHGRPKEPFWRDYADHIKMFSDSVAGVSLKVEETDDPEARAMELLGHYEDVTGRAFPLDPWEALHECIDAVFHSFNSERAKAYRQHNDIRGVIGTAVNVQAMFPSERAGIVFTANPNDITAGEMVIEASWGLGEVVVSGAVTPDSYVVDAESAEIKHKLVPAAEVAAPQSIGDDGTVEPALTDEQIHELVEIGKRVESYMGVPQDIEWGLADGRFNLLQTRNVRNLDVLEDVEAGREAEIERLLEEAEGKHVVWVAHNLGETLPRPTPLTWDILRDFMSGSGGFGLMYQDFGYQPSETVWEDGFLELICGRVYVDPRRAAGLFWRDLPGEYRPDDILEDPTVLERPPNKLNMDETHPTFFLRLPRLVWNMIRCSRKMKRARAEARRAFEDVALPRFLRFVEECRRTDLRAMETDRLVAELDRRRHAVLDDFGKESLKPGYFGGMAQQALEGILVQLMGDEKGSELTRVLTTGLENDTTVEQNILLYKVAQGEATLEQFLEEFGHRATNEMELSQPRWREDPSYIERMVENFKPPGRASPEERHQAWAEERRKVEADLPNILFDWGGSSLLELIRPELQDAQQLLPYRETAKHYLMMGYEQIRSIIVELGRRWDLGRGVFFLHLDELPRFEADRDRLVGEIEQRQLRWKSQQKLTVGDVIDSEHLDKLGRPEPREEGEELRGRAVASGMTVGTARIVFDPQEVGDLGDDYILVCPSTDPGWTPLFVNARGLVVERGGVLSHGAIVARDFGIPAVVCERSTQLIPDGARIELDGNRGVITPLDE